MNYHKREERIRECFKDYEVLSHYLLGYHRHQNATDICTEKMLGSYWYCKGSTHRRFHPEVIRQIKEIFGL